MKKTFLVFLILSCFITSAQKTSIPDPNFEKALIELGIDSGPVDGWVSSINIADIKTLEIPGKNISDLTGIEAFTKLEQLTIGVVDDTPGIKNNISNLNLSNNLKLTYLICGFNNLTYLNLTNNINLKVLYINNNKLNSIDLSKNTLLNTLDCRGNNLTSINVSKNTYLTGLNVSMNQLSNLDISQNLALNFLHCYDNQLSNLDITKNIKLENLFCGLNKLTNLDVSKNTILKYFNCQKNQISNLDIHTNTYLEGIECQENQLTDLDVSKSISFFRIDCNNNLLTALDVSKNINLRELTINQNKISSLDISKNIALTSLTVSYNNLTNLDVSKNTALKVLNCSKNQLIDLDLSKNPALIVFYCHDNQLTSLNLKNGKNSELVLMNFKSNIGLSCIEVDNAAYSNANWSTYKDSAVMFSNNCSAISSTAPILKATGNQVYCPKNDINIVTDFSIAHDMSETGTQAVYIQISSGYSSGFDKLRLLNPLSHPNIIENWDAMAGKLTLKNTSNTDILYTDIVAAVKDVVFSNPSASASGVKTFSITIGQANFLPSTGHFYQFISNVGIKWTEAKIAAENSTYYGLQGYLATITAADEAKLSGEQASGAGWIGGSDAETENVWKWVTGPEGLANNETGTVFWNGLGNGSTPNFAYWNTLNNEPNQAGDEDYAHITAPGVGIPGSWNDLSNTGSLTPGDNYQPKGYIVEYGGMPGESPLEIAASTQITIPEATVTSPAPIRDSGSLTLNAVSNVGTIRWFDTAVGGNLLQTGNTYTTPIINSTTTYYADAGCEINRKPVVATVNKTPDAPTVSSSVSRCGTGSVTLTATSNIGVINWFTDATGGTSVYTGNSFNTPSVSANTTYYAEASNSGCINPDRIPANITVYNPPVVTDEELVLCERQTVLLDAKVSGMSYKWSTGETTQTISVSASGSYNVEVTSPNPENCSSTKNINVIEYKKPIIKNIETKQRTVVINLSNPQDYFEYSVDGNDYQNSNTFYDVPGGLQTAFVRTKNNLCSSNQTTQTFVVLIIPAFFTPNNDTFNDFWEVTGMENYPKAQVTIFDQYGKLLIQLSGSKISWDGTFNKVPLPASDYWYALKIDDTKPVFKGHFSLKR